MTTAADLRMPDDGVNEVDLEPEMAQEELRRLRDAIKASREEFARGEGMPAEVLLEDIDRVFAEG